MILLFSTCDFFWLFNHLWCCEIDDAIGECDAIGDGDAILCWYALLFFSKPKLLRENFLVGKTTNKC